MVAGYAQLVRTEEVVLAFSRFRLSRWCGSLAGGALCAAGGAGGDRPRSEIMWESPMASTHHAACKSRLKRVYSEPLTKRQTTSPLR